MRARDASFPRRRHSDKVQETPMTESSFVAERILSGPEKAAALLLMMGPPTAARLLKHLDQPDLRSVTRAAAALGAVPPAALDLLVEEFAASFAGSAPLLGDADQVRSLLAEALPPAEIDIFMESALGGAGEMDVWEALAGAPEGEIIAFL